MNGHGGNRLTHLEARHALPKLIDSSDEVPARRVGNARGFRMYTFARQDIRETDARRQHFHPYLACLRGGDVLFNDSDHFRTAVARDENSLIAHAVPVRHFWGHSDHGGEFPKLFRDDRSSARTSQNAPSRFSSEPSTAAGSLKL